MQRINVNSWKDGIMDFALSLTEIFVSIIKAISIVGGIIGASLADWGFGALALKFMFGGSGIMISNMTADNMLSISISIGTSAIQIYMWTLLNKRGIGLKHLVNFKRLPSDIKGFLIGAGAIWLFDTILDISPLSILIKGSLYEGGSWYDVVKTIVYILVFLLCGFSEILTANMRQMLETGNAPKPVTNNNNNNGNNGSRGHQAGGNQPNRGSNQPNANNNNPKSNGAGDVASYLASKTNMRPAPKPTQAQPTGQTEPTYHPIGMKHQDTSSEEDFDDIDVDNYMEMLNKLSGAKE